jgi:hypothetical protein
LSIDFKLGSVGGDHAPTAQFMTTVKRRQIMPQAIHGEANSSFLRNELIPFAPQIWHHELRLTPHDFSRLQRSMI